MSEAKTGPVTFDEISAIIGDSEIPNAGKMRTLLGDRGSNTTIQKHLDAIRAARAPAAPAADAAPAAPAEALAALWSAATAAATAHVYVRIESISAERDALRLMVQQLEGDRAAANEEVDAERTRSALATAAAAAAAEQTLALKTQELQAALDRQIARIVELSAMVERLTPPQQ